MSKHYKARVRAEIAKDAALSRYDWRVNVVSGGNAIRLTGSRDGEGLIIHSPVIGLHPSLRGTTFEDHWKNETVELAAQAAHEMHREWSRQHGLTALTHEAE